MAGIAEVVRGLGARSGVEAVLVLSADGLPIEHASRVPFEPALLEILGADVFVLDTADSFLIPRHVHPRCAWRTTPPAGASLHRSSSCC